MAKKRKTEPDDFCRGMIFAASMIYGRIGQQYAWEILKAIGASDFAIAAINPPDREMVLTFQRDQLGQCEHGIAVGKECNSGCRAGIAGD